SFLMPWLVAVVLSGMQQNQQCFVLSRTVWMLQRNTAAGHISLPLVLTPSSPRCLITANSNAVPVLRTSSAWVRPNRINHPGSRAIIESEQCRSFVFIRSNQNQRQGTVPGPLQPRHTIAFKGSEELHPTDPGSQCAFCRCKGASHYGLSTDRKRRSQEGECTDSTSELTVATLPNDGPTSAAVALVSDEPGLVNPAFDPNMEDNSQSGSMTSLAARSSNKKSEWENGYVWLCSILHNII
ncbi:hypothetical protein GOODEAATRI_001284, partial [Goodea atripinnis]